jgi:hypothetical protein
VLAAGAAQQIDRGAAGDVLHGISRQTPSVAGNLDNLDAWRVRQLDLEHIPGAVECQTQHVETWPNIGNGGGGEHAESVTFHEFARLSHYDSEIAWRGMEQKGSIAVSPIYVRLAVTLAGVVLSTSIVSAQQVVRLASTSKAVRPAVKAGALRAGREARSLINGVAMDSDRHPLKQARVRLRNLEINEVEQTALSSERGEFSFAVRPDVPYVVELTDQTGRVVAVGDIVTTNIGEVAASIVSLPSRLPALAGMFGDTASSVISAATGTGLTVVDPDLPKVSPRE